MKKDGCSGDAWFIGIVILNEVKDLYYKKLIFRYAQDDKREASFEKLNPKEIKHSLKISIALETPLEKLITDKP